MSAPLYAAFLGTWTLDPASCDYQQGDAPHAGSYRIREDEGKLFFELRWIDSGGEEHLAELSGVPDGSKAPFAGGDLADALSIDARSPRELNSSAYWRGKERMIAQRQLDQTGTAMRVTQVVFLPDGSHSANVSIYRKQVVN